MKQIHLALFVGLFCVTTTIYAQSENTPVYNIALKQGIKKCLPAIKKISELLLKDTDNGASCTYSTKTADAGIFKCMVEVNYSDGNSIISISMTPTSSGTCDGEYSRTNTWKKNCAAVSKETFSELEYKDQLSKNVTTLITKDKGAYVYLVGTQDGGCLSIKTETLRDFK